MGTGTDATWRERESGNFIRENSCESNQPNPSQSIAKEMACILTVPVVKMVTGLNS